MYFRAQYFVLFRGRSRYEGHDMNVHHNTETSITDGGNSRWKVKQTPSRFSSPTNTKLEGQLQGAARAQSPLHLQPLKLYGNISSQIERNNANNETDKKGNYFTHYHAVQCGRCDVGVWCKADTATALPKAANIYSARAAALQNVG